MSEKNNKLKTLIIFAPFIEIGGIEKNLVILTNYLAKHIRNIALITWNKKDKKLFNKRVKFIKPSSIFLRYKNRNVRNIISIFLLINFIINNKDSVIFSFQSNLYVTIVAKIFNIKNIIRIASYGWMLNRFKKIIFYLILRLPNQIIVNSNDLRKNLKKELNINSKCIYNPLNINQINNSKKTKKKLFKGGKKILKILFLGRLVHVKNPMMFVKALNIINKNINFRALIVGKGRLEEQISNYIKINNLEKKVKILKQNSNGMQFLNQCDLIILTSKYEGLPNVLIEAQFLKKYIISTNCKTGPSEILMGGKLGTLVNIDDYIGLKKKIEYFYYYKNSIEIKKKIREGFYHLYRFDFEKNCQNYKKVICKYL
tara:strand:- start:2876 stop:3988 length:1113 start_codon:yes stop_codon:yes gene_type:complete